MELWSRDLKRCEQRIDVPFNRFVIFNTNDFSFHGHPDKLNVPAYRSRRSIATYYYDVLAFSISTNTAATSCQNTLAYSRIASL